MKIVSISTDEMIDAGFAQIVHDLVDSGAVLSAIAIIVKTEQIEGYDPDKLFDTTFQLLDVYESLEMVRTDLSKKEERARIKRLNDLNDVRDAAKNAFRRIRSEDDES